MQLLFAASVALAMLTRSASGAMLNSRASGGLRGTSSLGQLVMGGGSDKQAAPGSCAVFVEMLGRVYYIRDQLTRTTDSLSQLGYKTGEEWVIDQGIGNVTPSTMGSVVCPMLANTSKPTTFDANTPSASVDNGPEGDSTKKSLLALRVLQGPQEEVPAEVKKEEESSGWIPDIVPSWLGGGSEPETTTKPPTPATDGAPAQEPAAATETPAAGQPQPPVNPHEHGAEPSETSEPPELPIAETPETPMEAGCPAGSLQSHVLKKLANDFAGVEKDREGLKTVWAIFEDLLLSIENGAMSLYNYRGCPAMGEHALKARHVCEVSREMQAKALRLQQTDVQEMASRLHSLKSRLRKIDGGKPTECYFADKQKLQQPLSPRDLGWCMQLQAVIDALLDGRKPQKQWLKDMGDGISSLGTMAMQLNRYIQDPVLKADKIPLNALKAMTRSWKDLLSPIQQIRIMGATRASQARQADSTVLELTGLLKNVSVEEKCIYANFEMRYSAKDCQSLRTQLTADAQARQTDLNVLQDTVRTMMLTASEDLINNKCEAPAMTPGCWLRMPTGCPNLPNWKSADQWTRDVFGEQSTGAGTDQGVCTVSRKLQMDKICGTTNAEMRFIAPISAF